MFVQANHHHQQNVLAAVTPETLNTMLGSQPTMIRHERTEENTLAPELSHFDYHRLDDLQSTKLMSRFDTKYLLPINRLQPLLRMLRPDYSLLKIRECNQFQYESTYFDTPGFSFFHMHHNGKLNRYKVRHRRYVDTNTCFLEVKFKNNKKRTVKNRVQLFHRHGNAERVRQLIERTLGRRFFPLRPSLKCHYARIAMANKHTGERLTLDLNLHFEQPTARQGKKLDRVLIAELKQDRRKADSPFARLMNKWRYKPLSFSKYCVGCCYLNAHRIRTNRFKTTLLALEKLER